VRCVAWVRMHDARVMVMVMVTVMVMVMVMVMVTGHGVADDVEHMHASAHQTPSTINHSTCPSRSNNDVILTLALVQSRAWVRVRVRVVTVQ